MWMQETGAVYPAGYEPTLDDYLRARDAINIPIVGEWANLWLQPGSTSFKLNMFLGEETSADPVATKIQTFTFRETQKIRIIPIAVDARPERGYAVVAPDPNSLKTTANKLKVLFPINEEDVANNPIQWVEEHENFIRTMDS